MKNNLLLLILTLAQSAFVLAQDYQVPEFKNEPMMINSDGSPGRLEITAGDAKAASTGAGWTGPANMEYVIFPGAHSTVKTGTDTRFIIKLTDAEVDPDGLLFLCKAIIHKNTRIVYTTKSYESYSKDMFIDCNFEKLSPGVYKLTPKALKPDTEYGFVFRKNASARAAVFMFGTN